MKKQFKYASKIEFNNKLFQIIIRDDNKVGFYRIDGNNLVLPSAFEFLHLYSVINVGNKIKF